LTTGFDFLLPKKPSNEPQNPLTSLPIAMTSSAVFLIETNCSLADLYKSTDAWIFLTKPAARRQMEIGSIFYPL